MPVFGTYYDANLFVLTVFLANKKSSIKTESMWLNYVTFKNLLYLTLLL